MNLERTNGSFIVLLVSLFESESWPKKTNQLSESSPYFIFRSGESWPNCYRKRVNWWWILTYRFCWKGEQRWRLEVGRFKMPFDACISINAWETFKMKYSEKCSNNSNKTVTNKQTVCSSNTSLLFLRCHVVLECIKCFAVLGDFDLLICIFFLLNSVLRLLKLVFFFIWVVSMLISDYGFWWIIVDWCFYIKMLVFLFFSLLLET